ncbi:hypothetical protein CDL15_Pgr027464 [Punica granatum]|uniref:histone acetyltransferase n=1 Tax=Punica granatum TaxID=22663 RepID=A0A218XIA8_PUNGR|nr:hypothetical protein CDL15_Pgr027464 [Punica granatum]
MIGKQYFLDPHGRPWSVRSEVGRGHRIPAVGPPIDWRLHPRMGDARSMMKSRIIRTMPWAGHNYEPSPDELQLAAALEEKLFMGAASVREYLDLKTLHHRVQILLQQTSAEKATIANQFYNSVPAHQVGLDASCHPCYSSTDHTLGYTAVSSCNSGRCSLPGCAIGLRTEFSGGQGPFIDGYSKGHGMLSASYLKEQQPSQAFTSDAFVSLEGSPYCSRYWDKCLYAGACDGGVVFPQVNPHNSYGASLQGHGIAQKNLQCRNLRNVSPVQQRDLLCLNSEQKIHFELPSNQFYPLDSVEFKGTSTCSGSRVSAASNPSYPSGAQWISCQDQRKRPQSLVSSWSVAGKSQVLPPAHKRLKTVDQFGYISSKYEIPRDIMMIEQCMGKRLPKLQQYPESPVSIDSQYDVVQPIAEDIPDISWVLKNLVQGSSEWNHGNAVSPLEEIFGKPNMGIVDKFMVEPVADFRSGQSGSTVTFSEERTLGCEDGGRVMEDTSKLNVERQDLATGEALADSSGLKSDRVPILSGELNSCFLEERTLTCKDGGRVMEDTSELNVEKQDLATSEALIDSRGLRSDSICHVSEERNPCVEEKTQIIEPDKGFECNPCLEEHNPCHDKGFECERELSEAVSKEVHEVPMSGGRKITGASLLEFFTREQIEKHLTGLKESSCQIILQEKDAAHTATQTPCQLCGEGTLFFAPVTIYCSSCGKIINCGGKYYTPQEVGEKFYLCSTCYGCKGKVVQFRGGSISKEKLEKRTHDEKMEEPWVQCEWCQAWQHQICGLFNERKNVGGNAEYVCPLCCLKVINDNDQMTFRNGCAFSAKDLPCTKLSDHLERRLNDRLKQERECRAKDSGKNFHEVPGAEDLVVRVVLSLPRKVEVDKQFLGIFHGINYRSELPYKSKAIALFQKIEGVDVFLFGMYVQEYGSDCSQPNNRCVYISYLDSVKYLCPDIKSAYGESLRTFVYHEILVGYLEYCKKRGFASCYLWVCPPTKGDDFLLYCHPKFQKNLPIKTLRKWYRTMFSKAIAEKIVLSSTNLCEFYFAPSGCDKLKITAARLPYFEGDYWPSKLENILKVIDQKAVEESDKKVKNMSKRAMKACKSLSNDSPKDILLMEKIEHSMKDNKDDFMVAHLQYICTCCHEVILSGKRWFCNHCKKLQLCERCVDAEVGRTAEDVPVCRAKHLLSQAIVDPAPSDTEDGDITIENKLFENRHSFLAFCQENHYQFDTLRQAKHSSMMILYHLNERKEQVTGNACSLCQEEIFGSSWMCKICLSFHACKACYMRQDFSHSHELTPSSSDDPAAEIQFKWLVCG